MTKEEFLAMSLPYGLKAQFPESNKKGCKKKVIGTIGCVYDDGSITCYDTVNATPDKFKPILIPLKDYKDINSLAFQNLNCDLIAQVEINLLAKQSICYTSLQIGALEVCLKNHIDLADLISKGEAIDVNTLPENPYK